MTTPTETVTSKEAAADTPARASESSERQKLVHQMDKLASVVPPMPGIVLRLQQELANEWVNIQKLSNLVRTDPTLAGSVLRVANSPYWRGTRQIVEIEEAIQRMGMETLRSITTVMAMRSAKISDKGPAGSSMRDFWKHSLLVAVGSVQIARRSPVDRQGLEQVWMAGLLHDIGSLLSPMLFPVGWTRVLEEIQRIPAASPAKPEAKDADATEDDEEAVELPPRLDLLDIERLHMETDHGRIGGAFVERHWNLPGPIALLVENWTEPSRLTPPLLAWAVQRADAAAQVMGVCWQPESTRCRTLEDLPKESGAGAACDAAQCMECLEKSLPLVEALLTEA